MLNQPQSRVAILLPRRERYAQSGAGAVSTVVDGFARHSAYRDSLTIFGAPVDDSLQGATFVPVVSAPWWRGGPDRRYLAGAVRYLKDKAAIVEIHNRPKYVSFLRRKLPQAALILYLHNDPRTMEGAKTIAGRRNLAAQIQGIVCVSDYIRRCFLEGLEDLVDKVAVQPNAVDTAALAPLPTVEKRKEIIFVGRTIADKGLHLLVAAAEKLLPEFPDWKLVVVGGRYFGTGKAETYEKDLFARVAQLGPQGEVTGYVPRSEVVSRLQQASIAVLPSLWEEPIMMAGMEAAACGCAVITTRRGGIPEGLGDAALYLSEETPKTVETSLRALLSNPSILCGWQQKAREHVVQNGDIRAAARHLDALREKVHTSFTKR